MPAAHQIDIHHVAKLARLSLSEDEAGRYASQLDGILTYIDTLTRYNLDGVEPTAHAMPVYDVLRVDEARPGFTQEQALANAPKRTADQFQISKVIE
jgi:aspartyl-tRNA(Asn)/glutamyl-tRNA(Gln) amidotransferase subunit C